MNRGHQKTLKFVKSFPSYLPKATLSQPQNDASSDRNIRITGLPTYYPCCLGGSPGLVVMGDDSYSRRREFESRRRILDGLCVAPGSNQSQGKV